MKSTGNILICSRSSIALANNAFDLLSTAVEIFKEFEGGTDSWNQHKLKSALLLVAASIELLLKSKIAITDWRQVYQNPDEANEVRFRNGDFYSVKFSHCIKRIEDVCSITIDSRIKKRVNNIETIRNKIVHFHPENEEDKFISLISYGIDIFIEFYRSYIYTPNETYKEPDRTKDIDIELKEIKKYTSIRLATIKKKFIDYNRPRNQFLVECNNCYQEDTIVLKDRDTIMCIYCGDENEIEDVAKLCSSYNWQTRVCPACGRKSMAAVHMSEEEDPAWDCLICGYYINRPMKWIEKNEYAWTGPIRKEMII